MIEILRSSGVVATYASLGELRRLAAEWFDSSRSAAPWLSAAEREATATMTDYARLEAWRLGRLLAKYVVLRKHLANKTAPWTDVELLPRQARGLSARATLLVRGVPTRRAFSLSHSELGVLVAVADDLPATGPVSWLSRRVGVDLTRPEIPKLGFLNAWFSAGELSLLNASGQADELPVRAALMWGAKEATYKALNNDETFDPRRFETTAIDARQLRCVYKPADGAEQSLVVRYEPTPEGELAILAVGQEPLDTSAGRDTTITTTLKSSQRAHYDTQPIHSSL